MLRCLLIATLAATAQRETDAPSIEDLSWLIGDWEFDDSQVGGDDQEVGTRSCRFDLRESYIVCDSRGVTRSGRKRSSRFYVNYNPRSERFEMVGIFGDVPAKNLYVLEVSEGGHRVEMENREWASNGLTSMSSASIEYNGRDRYVWNIRSGEADPETGERPVTFRSTVTRASVPDESARTLRLRGELDLARAVAERELASPDTSPARDVALRLELARIHDRYGLHRDMRPVPAALEHLQRAESVVQRAGPAAAAALQLGYGTYFYRAEMSERLFEKASSHTERAIAQFRELGDRHGEADAVHQMGLIRLQQGELDEARALFDESLELDVAGGARTFFRGEYERHVAFTYLLDGRPEPAIPHLERSLDARRTAGAVDASAFAATSLAAALVSVGRAEDAKPHALYAAMVAERINSPVGKARNALVLGRIYLAEKDTDAARLSFELARKLGRSVNSNSIARDATDGIDALGVH